MLVRSVRRKETAHAGLRKTGRIPSAAPAVFADGEQKKGDALRTSFQNFYPDGFCSVPSGGMKTSRSEREKRSLLITAGVQHLLSKLRAGYM